MDVGGDVGQGVDHGPGALLVLVLPVGGRTPDPVDQLRGLLDDLLELLHDLGVDGVVLGPRDDDAAQLVDQQRVVLVVRAGVGVEPLEQELVHRLCILKKTRN